MIVPVLRELFRVASRALVQYNRLEKKSFDKLYSGFPRGTGRGVRHGLTAGAGLGSLLNDDGGVGDDGEIPFQKRTKPNQFKKTRTRRRRRFGGRDPKCYRPNRRSRF